MKKSLLLLLNLFFIVGFGQEYRMLNGSNGVKVTCAGTFTDNMGTAAVYSNNQNSTITFTPVNPGDAIRVYFTSFNTEGTGTTCYDYLQVWHNNIVTNAAIPDESYCGILQPFTITSNNLSNGSLTFKFVSNAAIQKSGWVATISCITPCHPPTAVLAGPNNVALCNATVPQTVTLDASGSSSPTTQFSIVKYDWSWGDGTTSTTTTPTATHTYSQYGIYRASVRVYDNNFIASPSTGCASTNSALKYIKVLPPPTYNSTTTTVNATCGQSINLEAIARSSNINEVAPSVVTAPIHLPDGVGTSVESEINLSGYFASGATMSSGCYPTVKFSMEHSFARDLTIDLIAPNGQTIRLFNRQFLNGENFGTCVNGNDDNIPGCPAEYTVVASGGASWTAASSFTNATTSCPTYTGPCETGAYSIAQAYNSSQSFTSLIGVPLNGIWKLKITDNQIFDDGFFAGWSISFPNSCYSSLQNVTTTLTNMTWTATGNSPAIASQNTTLAPLPNPGPNACPTSSCVGTLGTSNATVGPFTQTGTYTYTNTVTNSLGCTNTQVFTINVTCTNTLTLASATSTLTQNLCSGVAITPIVFNFSGNASALIFSLPAGLSSAISGNTLTITGSTTSNQSFTVSMAGATQSFNANITITTPNVVINGPTNYCYYSTYIFTSNVPGGTWSFSDPNIGYSATSGKAELRGFGYSTVYYTVATACGTITVSKQINIFYPEKFFLYGPDTMCANESGVFLSASYSDGVWSSSDPTIADINPTTGELYPHHSGTVSFYYTMLPSPTIAPLVYTKTIAIYPFEIPTISVSGSMTWDSSTNSYTPVTINVATTYPGNYMVTYYADGIAFHSSLNEFSVVVNHPGVYTVSCQYSKTSCTSISAPLTLTAPPPLKTSVTQNGSHYTIDVLVDSSDSNIDSSNFQYQLDNGEFQAGSTFYDVTMGLHTVTVKEPNQSFETKTNVEALGYTKFFTPNNDGANDDWTIENFEKELKDSSIKIFDRNNNLVAILNNANTRWNGNDLRGNPLPTDDYWFIMTFKDSFGNLKEIKNHFTLKRD